jgi:hypothetical protein
MKLSPWILVAAILTAASAHADPLRVTGGSLIGSDSNNTDFLMTGDGFELGDFAWPIENTDEPHYLCGYCQPGAQVSLSVRYDLFDVRYNGTYYGEREGLFSFVSETVTLPDVAPGGAGTLTRPFAFTGRVMGIGPGGALNLTGSGEVRVSYYHQPANSQEPSHVDITGFAYVFQETDPVPEPGTMLLLGSGLAGVVAARRRRKSMTTNDQRLATSD